MGVACTVPSCRMSPVTVSGRRATPTLARSEAVQLANKSGADRRRPTHAATRGSGGRWRRLLAGRSRRGGLRHGGEGVRKGGRERREGRREQISEGRVQGTGKLEDARA